MSGRILVVEDDADIREDLAELLRDEGYDVATAVNGEDGLALLRREASVGLILLDLMMPVMDGWQFREAQLADPALASVPIIVLSADGDTPRKASALRANAYLTKPFALPRLLTTIHTLLHP